MHVKSLNHEFGVVAVAKMDYSDKAAWDYRSLLDLVESRVDIHDDLRSHAARRQSASIHHRHVERRARLHPQQMRGDHRAAEAGADEEDVSACDLGGV